MTAERRNRTLRSTDVRGSAATNLTGVTQILASMERGDPHAAEQLLPLVYEDARSWLSRALNADEREP